MLEKKIQELIEPSVEHMGYRLVRIRLNDQDGRRTLQIMAERKDDRPMGIEDCEEISYTVSAVLDVSDPIPTAYHLEVSSPGVDRPLVRREDFVTYAGFEAKLESGYPIDGRKRWRGVVNGMDGDDIVMSVDGAEHRIPFAALAQAKLVLTDELLAWYKEKFAPAEGMEGGDA
jgi:ribosome maturation factor RimP